MRQPVQTTMSEDEKDLVDAAVQRSSCNSRSQFIRAASLLTADSVLRLDREETNGHPEEEEESAHAR